MIGNGAQYRVIYFHDVRVRLKTLLVSAIAQGHGEVFIRTLREIDRRLRTDALNFGEILYTLKQAKLEVRLGGHDSFFVTFGIHLEKNLIFVVNSHELS